MRQRKSRIYQDGAGPARRTGKYADPDADIRCPHVTETPEAEEWQSGFDDTKRAMESMKSPLVPKKH